MFVRKKKNKSGVVSIQVIDKSSGKYKLLRTIGSSDNALEIESLFKAGKSFIKEKENQVEIDFNNTDEIFSKFIAGIREVNVIGTELLLGKIFDQIGFGQIKDELFKKLVILLNKSNKANQ